MLSKGYLRSNVMTGNYPTKLAVPPVTKEMRDACRFTDLAADWYKNPVIWAFSTGVVKGTSDTTFSPNDQITREQMAAIMARFDRLGA